MPNRWVMDNDGMVRWVADLSPALSRPAALLDWFATVLEAAETEEIWQVREAASLGYAFAEHGPLAPFLARQYAQTGVIDLGDFTYFGPNRYLTRLAYFDDQDQVVEALVDDLGRLMLQLHPPEAEKEFLGLCYPGLPALEIRGPLLDTRRPARSCNTLRGTEIRVYFQLYSDIWFPWVPGMIDEAYDLNKRFDNRALARVHTPRLNRVLAVARAATERLGGRWFLDRDPDNPGPCVYAQRCGGAGGGGPAP
ncbi:MAG: hypothetical protein RMJ55_10725 [Roseiflexaceae bacterium]|nr:hypothetical protein [Roseiflexaceae bacterium]